MRLLFFGKKTPKQNHRQTSRFEKFSQGSSKKITPSFILVYGIPIFRWNLTRSAWLYCPRLGTGWKKLERITVTLRQRMARAKSSTHMIWMCHDIPSRKLTYPTWGKGKSSSKCHFLEDMLVPWRIPIFCVEVKNLKNMDDRKRVLSSDIHTFGQLFGVLHELHKGHIPWLTQQNTQGKHTVSRCQANH